MFLLFFAQLKNLTETKNGLRNPPRVRGIK